MGYTTKFDGQITVEPPLNEGEIAFLDAFAEERHEGSEFPGYYCQWIPANDGTAIEWDEGEKFYHSVEWMEYLIQHFIGSDPTAKHDNPERFAFLPGHACNGTIHAQGEDIGDHWVLFVRNNKVTQQMVAWPSEPGE